MTGDPRRRIPRTDSVLPDPKVVLSDPRVTEAARGAGRAAAGCTDVECDLVTGERARRGRAAMAAEAEAEDVHVVNNNAAALVLTATASAPVAELTALPVPVVVDIGSGLLGPLPLLPDEPDARTALRDGAALVTASGDKLLGRPQAGLLLGRAEVVRRHPLACTLRVDKLTLAALEATLRGEPPVRGALAVGVGTLERRALAARLEAGMVRGALADGGVVGGAVEPSAEVVGGMRRPVEVVGGMGPSVEVVCSVSVVGGGGAPGVELPSVALLLDLRSVPPAQDEELVEAVPVCT
ncbi:hypothetical protein GCM10009850_007860 [Nonomuraea monospora]|uniref:L-seryl-tRNA(Sec) selenium transferase n=1 Tax=Nonomuraea monospora TaxID=568818 RepID=A0ABN3C914_9ACTN